MTQSYFKAIMWDNSNYVQEQRRSKRLVPLLDSSEPLAKTRLPGEEGERKEGQGGGKGGGGAEKGEEPSLAPGWGMAGRRGCPRTELSRQLSCQLLVLPGQPWFWLVLGYEGDSLSPGVASVVHECRDEPFPPGFPSFLLSLCPFFSHGFHRAPHMPTPAIQSQPSMQPTLSTLTHCPLCPPDHLLPFSLPSMAAFLSPPFPHVSLPLSTCSPIAFPRAHVSTHPCIYFHLSAFSLSPCLLPPHLPTYLPVLPSPASLLSLPLLFLLLPIWASIPSHIHSSTHRHFAVPTPVQHSLFTVHPGTLYLSICHVHPHVYLLIHSSTHLPLLLTTSQSGHISFHPHEFLLPLLCKPLAHPVLSNEPHHLLLP